ncbi:MAG: glycosyltransferase family 9 protein, partial [Magnetospirillum sp. WYHS-4]
MRILFITATRVGDAILSTGLLGHLLERMPGARVTVVCGTAAASLFDTVPGLERLIAVDKMPGSLHWPYLWSQCAGHVWDAVVDLRNSPLYYLLAARRRWRIGKRRWDTHRVRQLAGILGLADDPPTPRLWPGDAQAALAA